MYEETTHSFVVKVWLEEVHGATHHPLWRGHITHVMSNEQRHVQSLTDIAAFIGEYIAPPSTRLPISVKLKRWLSRRKT